MLIFLEVSGPGLVKEKVKSMANKPLVLALANQYLKYYQEKKVKPDAIIATGSLTTRTRLTMFCVFRLF